MQLGQKLVVGEKIKKHIFDPIQRNKISEQKVSDQLN